MPNVALGRTVFPAIRDNLSVLIDGHGATLKRDTEAGSARMFVRSASTVIVASREAGRFLF